MINDSGERLWIRKIRTTRLEKMKSNVALKVRTYPSVMTERIRMRGFVRVMGRTSFALQMVYLILHPCARHPRFRSRSALNEGPRAQPTFSFQFPRICLLQVRLELQKQLPILFSVPSRADLSEELLKLCAVKSCAKNKSHYKCSEDTFLRSETP